MNTLSSSLQENLKTLKKLLPSEDILTYEFKTADNVNCAVVYADGMVNKQLLGDLIARPLSKLSLSQKTQNEGGRVALNNNSTPSTPPYQAMLNTIETSALFPELKQKQAFEDCVKEVLDGNSLLLVDNLPVGLIVGAKFLPVRAIMWFVETKYTTMTYTISV